MDTKELTNLADKQWCHVYYKALQFVCVLIWLELDVCWIVFSGDALIYKNILYGFISIAQSVMILLNLMIPKSMYTPRAVVWLVSILTYDWTVNNEWKVTWVWWHDPELDVGASPKKKNFKKRNNKHLILIRLW